MDNVVGFSLGCERELVALLFYGLNNRKILVYIYFVGGLMANAWTPQLAVQIRDLVRVIVLGSWARHFTFTVSPKPGA